jgi:hypothetical protein
MIALDSALTVAKSAGLRIELRVAKTAHAIRQPIKSISENSA